MGRTIRREGKTFFIVSTRRLSGWDEKEREKEKESEKEREQNKATSCCNSLN